MGYIFVYVEVNIICVILLAYLLKCISRNIGSETEINTLKAIMVATMVMALSDALWALGELGPMPFAYASNVTINVIYAFCFVLAPYFWFRYTEFKLGKWQRYSMPLKAALTAPCVIALFMVCASPLTHWLFYIDEENHYTRGSLRIVYILFVYGYLIASGFHALKCSGEEKSKAAKKQNRLVASYAVLPLIFNTIQLIDVDIPCAAIGLTLPMLIVYIGMQNSMISSDSLTGLNNRRRADDYLEDKVNERRQDLVFMICDLDRFKDINDKFGHLEGDNALLITSNVMKKICEGHNAFLARYGGDEFCIIWNSTSEEAIGRLISDIQQKLIEKCKGSSRPYLLHMSFGYAVNTDIKTDTELFRIADQMLYENKKIAHEKSDGFVINL